MEQTKHTPGKWVINYDGSIYAEPTEDDKHSRRICGLPWDSYKEFKEGNNEANARLIATAPELLIACQKAEAYLQGIRTDEKFEEAYLVAMIQAAIAKAEAS